MSPSSSPSEPAAGGLFDGVLSRGPVAVAVSDAGWLRALLDVEAALARAGARTGLVPRDAAEAITAACADTGAYDPVALGQAATASGNPVVPLVRAVEAVAGPGAGRWVHLGATSQDVLDTAMVLVARRACGPLRRDLRGAAAAAAVLARRHGDDVLAGRTLGQQAVPTTFGLKAAGWTTGLDEADARLGAVVAGLPVQLGGAVGTLSALGEEGLRVREALADELDLDVPVLAWHTLRVPVADLAGALGTAAGVLGKVALDVVLLAQTEVGEVSEGDPSRGGSSTMPHKRNPVAAVSARAAALRAPGLVATLFAGLPQEHERAAGAWHAEWLAVSDLLRCTGSAAAWLRDALEHLQVHPDRMRANLEAAGQGPGAEAVAGALADRLGRAQAHDRVAAATRSAAAQRRPLADVLSDDPDVSAVLDAAALGVLLSPEHALGSARALTRAAVAAHDAHHAQHVHAAHAAEAALDVHDDPQQHHPHHDPQEERP